MSYSGQSFAEKFIRWLMLLLFSFIGAGLITFFFATIVSSSPTINEFSLNFLQQTQIDILMLVFLISLVFSSVCVFLLVPKKEKKFEKPYS